MRRFLLLLGIVVAALTVGITLYNRSRIDRWRSLPDGGEIRFLGVTYGEDAWYEMKPTRLEPLRKSLGRWGRFIGPPPLRAGGSRSEPGLVIWFQTRNTDPPAGNSIDEVPFFLVMGDKLKLWSGATNSRHGSDELVGVSYDDATRDVPRFHIRWSRDNQALDFDVANSFYPASLPITPEPKHF